MSFILIAFSTMTLLTGSLADDVCQNSNQPCEGVSITLADTTVFSAIKVTAVNGDLIFVNPSVTIGSLSYPLAAAQFSYENYNAFGTFCGLASKGSHGKYVSSQSAKNAGVWRLNDSQKKFVGRDQEGVYKMHLAATIWLQGLSNPESKGVPGAEILGWLGAIENRYNILQSITCGAQ